LIGRACWSERKPAGGTRGDTGAGTGLVCGEANAHPIWPERIYVGSTSSGRICAVRCSSARTSAGPICGEPTSVPPTSGVRTYAAPTSVAAPISPNPN